VAKSKKTIMVVISKTYTVTASVYFEALAKNVQAAENQARKYVKNNFDSVQADLDADRDLSLEMSGFETQVARVFSVGPASQYHSEKECKLCASVAKKKA
jgi:hypothetical protein